MPGGRVKVLGLAKSSSTCLERPGFGKPWARVCARSWRLVPAQPGSNNNSNASAVLLQKVSALPGCRALRGAQLLLSPFNSSLSLRRRKKVIEVNN